MQQIQTRDSDTKIAIHKLQYDIANLLVDYFQQEVISVSRHRRNEEDFNTCRLTYDELWKRLTDEAIPNEII